jgi:uncharacterized protein involved in outer membrane biogenesis
MSAEPLTSSEPPPPGPGDAAPAPPRRKRWPLALRLLIAAVLLVGLYAALGFWVAPRVIRSQVISQIAARYHRKAALGEVRLNPFTLELQADRFSLPDADGAPMIAFDGLTVRVSPASIWRGLAFSEINLDAPRVRLVVRPDGRLNLLDLVPPPPAHPQPNQPPPKLLIDHLTVQGGRVQAVDLADGARFEKTFEPVRFSLRDFSTVKDGAGFVLKAATDRGEGFAWRGTLGLAPVASQGRFTVGGLQAVPLTTIAKDALPFDLTSGKIDLWGRYDFAVKGPKIVLTVDLPEVILSQAGFRAHGADRDWVSLPSLVLSGVHVDLASRAARADRIEANAPQIEAWTDRSGVNLARYAGPPAKAKPEAKPAAQAPAQPAAGGWTVALPDLRVHGGKIAFEDRLAPRPIKLGIAPIELAVSGFSLPIQAPVQVSLDAGLDDGGKLAAKGPVTLDKLAADLDVSADRVGLTRWQPYVDRAASLKLLSGRFSGHGQVHYAASGATTFTGSAEVDGLHTTDKLLNQDFINWRALRFDGIDLATQPFSMKVRQVTADKAYARVVLEPNYDTNIKTVLTVASAPTKPDKSAKPAANPPAATSAAATSAASQSPSKGLPIEIGLVKVNDGRMDYSDLTLNPHFAAGIQALSGTIKGLSGKPDARADVDLAGQVDRYSPVKIGGQVNYFAARTYTDLKMSFQNLELTTFSPYSGKFAGYRIDKGKMNVDLHYNIDDQKLHAEHRVVINQLQLGDKVDSASAVKLPVKLIVALLKDRNGVIDIPIIIDGTLDDPKFRIWPVIWKVVENLFVKIIASPFTLLGHLVGGGEELSYVDFAPGSAVLDPGGKQKLATLAKALVERPALNLQIPMTVDPQADRPVLIETAFQDEVRAAALERLGKKAAKPGAADAALAKPKSRRDILERLYQKTFAAKPDIPKPQPGPDGKKPDADAAAVSWLEDKLRGRVTVSDDELKKLGQDRAQAAEDALLADGKIAPSRVFVITAPPVTTPTPRMTLSLN